MGTHLRVLSVGYLMNTNMTGFSLDSYQKYLHSWALNESRLIIISIDGFKEYYFIQI